MAGELRRPQIAEPNLCVMGRLLPTRSMTKCPWLSLFASLDKFNVNLTLHIGGPRPSNGRMNGPPFSNCKDGGH